MMNINNKGSRLLGLVLACGSLTGCTEEKTKPVPKPSIETNSPVERVEKIEGYEEAVVVGRSYSPGFDIKEKFKTSTETSPDGSKHQHDVEIELKQPEEYFLFVKLSGRTYTAKVDKITFNDTNDGSIVMAKYVEQRLRTYRQDVPEKQVLSDYYNGLEIKTIEQKPREPAEINKK